MSSRVSVGSRHTLAFTARRRQHLQHPRQITTATTHSFPQLMNPCHVHTCPPRRCTRPREPPRDRRPMIGAHPRHATPPCLPAHPLTLRALQDTIELVSRMHVNRHNCTAFSERRAHDLFLYMHAMIMAHMYMYSGTSTARIMLLSTSSVHIDTCSSMSMSVSVGPLAFRTLID